MKNLVSLFMPLIISFIGPREQRVNWARVVLTLIAFILVIASYILGCMSLYYYLNSHWEKPLSLLMICLFLLLTSFILLGIGYYYLKPKKRAPDDFLTTITKSLMSPDDFINKALSTVTPKVLAGIFGLSVIVSYFMLDDKKDS